MKDTHVGCILGRTLFGSSVAGASICAPMPGNLFVRIGQGDGSQMPMAPADPAAPAAAVLTIPIEGKNEASAVTRM